MRPLQHQLLYRRRHAASSTSYYLPPLQPVWTSTNNGAIEIDLHRAISTRSNARHCAHGRQSATRSQFEALMAAQAAFYQCWACRCARLLLDRSARCARGWRRTRRRTRAAAIQPECKDDRQHRQHRRRRPTLELARCEAFESASNEAAARLDAGREDGGWRGVGGGGQRRARVRNRALHK